MSGKVVLIAVIFFIFGGLVVFSGIRIFSSSYDSNLDIYFFLGGEKSGSFSGVVYEGVKSAEKQLGLNIKYVESFWDASVIEKQLWEIYEKKPDIIILPAFFWNDSKMKVFMDSAKEKGILVTFWNSDSLVRDKYVLNGAGYVGQDTYMSGKQLAEYAIENYPLPNKRAMIFGVENFNLEKEHTIREMRTLGIYDKLIDYEINTTLVILPDANSSNIMEYTKRLYEEHIIGENLDAIFIDSGRYTDAFAEVIKLEGVNPNEYVLAGFDLSSTIYDSLKEGYVDFVNDQQPYLEGYLSTINAYLSKKYGFSGLYIDTGVGIVTSEEVTGLKELIDLNIR